MKALFLLQSDPYLPKPCLRALREARTLRESGWEVRFVSWIQHGGPVSPGVIPVYAETPAMGHPLRRLQVLRQATQELALAVIRENPDLIVAHDLEVLPAAVTAKRVTGGWLVYDAHEDWPSLIRQNSRLEAWAAARIENRCLRFVDAVVTISEPAAVRFRLMGKPTYAVLSSRPRREIRRAERGPSRRALGISENDFVVGYAGSPSQDQRLDLLRSACDRIGAHCLIVNGIPYSDLPPYFAAMDVGVLPLRDTPNNRIALPNKLFDYMAYGVPIVAPDYPAIHDFLNWGCGLLIGEMSEAELVRAFRALRADPRHLEKMSATGMSVYDWLGCWEQQEFKFLLAAHVDGPKISRPPMRAVSRATDARLPEIRLT